MIIRKRIVSLFLATTLLMPLTQITPLNAESNTKEVDVMFTHDTHSHLDSFTTNVDGELQEVGGFARIKTLINEQKKENPNTLILDGGDFSMGTLIQTVYDTQAAELRMLGYLGYDVTTLGNHEFDYRSKGLANMLKAAKASGETIPNLVVCNVDWAGMKKSGLSKGQKQIQSGFETYGVKDYVVIQKGDTKIAVTGAFGKDSLECAPTCELLFKDPVEAVKDTVEKIKKKEKVDMIVCVSHCGTWEDENKSEDELLAKNVNDIEFNSLEELYSKHEESNLGQIIADSFAYAVDSVDVAVVPSGTIRDTYTKGDITVENVYNSFSLGIGKDGMAGYPLISTYLTGKELKLAAEVDASVSDFMTTARLYCSGLNFTYNPNRMILNKVTDCYLTKEGQRIEIQDNQLYHVVTDLYTGQMLGSVNKLSYGLLSLEPKDKDGNPIENLENHIIKEDGKELKAWDAIARYMRSFDDTDGDGISNVSKYYASTHEHKVVDDSKNIIDLIKKPNKFSAMVVAIVLVIILLIVLLILLICKIVHKIKNKNR